MLILPANSITGGYTVDNSLRFDSGSSDYINRTIGTATNNKKITFSFWVKRSKLTSRQMFVRIIDPSSTASYSYIEFDGTTDVLTYDDYDGSSTRITRTTNQVFRDVSAWYHIVISVDTTQATGSDRAKVYVNGSQVTSFAGTSDATQNYVLTGQTSGKTFYIGAAGDVPSLFLSGYLAEFVVIDGQALDPTSFGEFDEDSGIWKPIDVSGLTFGTNGFYLDFENSGSLGADVSGNGNNFTVNNLTSIDQTTDTPTNNYATLNPLVFQSTGVTFSEGNLKYTISTGSNRQVVSTIGVTKGKWYFENKVSQKGGYNTYRVGLSNFEIWSSNNNMYQEALGQKASAFDIGYESTGSVYANNSTVATGLATYTNGDIIGVAYDLDNNYVYFSKNGTFINSGNPTSGSSGTGGFSITNGYNYTPAIQDSGFSTSAIFDLNYGNPPFTISSGNSDGNGYGNFEYSVPSGYYALNTKNLAEFG